MNRHIAIFLLVAAAAAGNVYADDITVETTPFVSTMSRAEVQADLQQFRASGSDPYSEDQLAGFRSERSRADVTAEYIAERDQVSAFNGEDSGSVMLARRDTQRPAQMASLPGAAE